MRTVVVAFVVALAAAGNCSVEQMFSIEPTDAVCQTLDTACSDIWTATMCKRVKQCIPRWEVLETPVGNDTELCALCKQMVQEAKDQLTSNETQDEIRQVLYGSCQILLHFEPLYTLCDKLMESFIEQLDDMLISRMDPTQVCTVSGLCWTKDSNLFNRLLHLARLPQHHECDSCQNTISTIKDFSKVVPQEMVVQAFLTVCEQTYGRGNEKCHKFARTYVAKFFQRLQIADPSSTCAFFDQCPGGVPMPAMGANEDLECEFCEAMIHKVAVQFNNTSTKTEVKKVLLALCKDTGSYADACTAKVTNNFDEAYDVIMKLLDPERVCLMIGICHDQAPMPMVLPLSKLSPASPRQAPKRSLRDNCQTCQLLTQFILDDLKDNKTEEAVVAALEKVCPYVPLNAAECKTMVDTYATQLFDLVIKGMTAEEICTFFDMCPSRVVAMAQPREDNCPLCKVVISYVIDSVKDNNTEAAIMAALDKVCSIIPMNEAECLNYVNTYAKMLIDYVIKGLTADEICSLIGLCSTPPPPPKVTDGEFCEVCDMVVGFVIDEVKANATEDSIILALEKVCNVIPMNEAKCKNLVDEYGDKIIKAIINNVSADKVCEVIGLCPTSKPKAIRTDYCSTCEMLVGFVIDEVKDNSTEEAIIAALEKVCSIIPIDATECKNAVDVYGNEIIKYILNGLTADEICKELGLCATLRPRAVKVDFCSTCEMLVGFVIDEVKDNATEESIVAALKKVCIDLPSGLNGECMVLVDAYADQIIKYILSGLTADKICTEIDLCPDTKPKATVGDSCSACAFIAGFIVNEIQDNKTEEAIIAALCDVCNLLPSGDQYVCKNLVDNYARLFFTSYVNNVTPDQVCFDLGLCSTGNKLKDNTFCTECEMISDLALPFIQDKTTQQEVVQILAEACDKLPTDAVSACKSWVNNDVPQYLQWINSQTSESICTFLTLCDQKKMLSLPQTNIKDPECTLCKEVAVEFLEEARKPEVQKFVRQHIGGICKLVPLNGCDAFFNNYLDRIFAMINDVNTTPEVVCKSYGLCSSQMKVKGPACTLCKEVATEFLEETRNPDFQNFVRQNVGGVCKLVPINGCDTFFNKYLDELFAFINDNKTTPDLICQIYGLCSSQQAPVKECGMCGIVVDWIVDEVVDNKTEQEIIDVIEKACKILPANDAQECKNVIDTYGKMIIEMIKNDMTAQAICSALGLCSLPPRAVAVAAPMPAPVPVRMPTAMKDDQNCQLCMILVNVVEAELENKKTQGEIISVLQHACSLFPKNDEQECLNMINTYTAIIIGMIESMESPEGICQTLSFCPVPPTNVECEICTFVTNYVESQLGENKTEAKIEELLGEVCKYLPGMNVAQCQQTVDQFTDMVIQLMLQMVPPRKICEEIKLCPVAKQLKKIVQRLPRPVAGVKDEVCDFCKWAITWVDNKLKDNRTEAAIVEELGKVCDMITDSVECKQMVSDYTDMIIKMLVEYADPDTICEAIGKCQKTKVLY